MPHTQWRPPSISLLNDPAELLAQHVNDATRGALAALQRAFADVAWNAPFYATCGFVESCSDTDFHRGLAAHEEALGLTAMGRRVEMCVELRPV